MWHLARYIRSCRAHLSHEREQTRRERGRWSGKHLFPRAWQIKCSVKSPCRRNAAGQTGRLSTPRALPRTGPRVSRVEVEPLNRSTLLLRHGFSIPSVCTPDSQDLEVCTRQVRTSKYKLSEDARGRTCGRPFRKRRHRNMCPTFGVTKHLLS